MNTTGSTGARPQPHVGPRSEPPLGTPPMGEWATHFPSPTPPHTHPTDQSNSHPSNWPNRVLQQLCPTTHIRGPLLDHRPHPTPTRLDHPNTTPTPKQIKYNPQTPKSKPPQHTHKPDSPPHRHHPTYNEHPKTKERRKKKRASQQPAAPPILRCSTPSGTRPRPTPTTHPPRRDAHGSTQSRSLALAASAATETPPTKNTPQLDPTAQPTQGPTGCTTHHTHQKSPPRVATPTARSPRRPRQGSQFGSPLDPTPQPTTHPPPPTPPTDTPPPPTTSQPTQTPRGHPQERQK